MVGRRERAHLGRDFAGGFAQEVVAVAGFLEVDVVEFVLLLVEDLVTGGAQGPPMEFIRAFGVVFGNEVKHVVGGAPFESGHLADLLRHEGAGGEIHDEDLVLAVAGPVDGVGEPGAVGAHAEMADRDIGVGTDHGVEVEEDFLGGALGGRPATIDRILPIFLRARVVSVAQIGDRGGGIVFLNARNHFVVEHGAEVFGRREHRFGVGVFLLEVFDDLRAALFPQPKIVVDARILVDGHILGLFCRDGRFGSAEVEFGGD